MSEWKIGTYTVEDNSFKQSETVERYPEGTKPMSWEEWYGEATRLGYIVREAYHTASGIHEAIDPATQKRKGMWKPNVGFFRDSDV